MFEEIYGLSCVENQVLSRFRLEGNEVSYLYHDSAVPLELLYDRLLLQGESPYDFRGLPRVQETLSRLGLLQITLTHPDPCRLRALLRSRSRGEHILIRVTPDYTKTRLHARGLREDHFVLAEPQRRGFLLTNDIPERTQTVSAAALNRIYDGSCLTLRFSGKLDAAVADRLWQERQYRPEEWTPTVLSGRLSALSDPAARLRNLLQIYKILRYRMAAYYGLYLDTCCIRGELPAIEQLAARAEYYNLRGIRSPEKLFPLLEKLALLDTAMMKPLKKQLMERMMTNVRKNRPLIDGYGIFGGAPDRGHAAQGGARLRQSETG